MMEFAVFQVSPLTNSLVIGIALIFVLTLIVKHFNKHNFRSPGPWGIPFLGYYPFLPKINPHIHLTELHKKYGDPYILSICGKLYLHLGSYKTYKEAFVTKSDCFSERSKDFSLFMKMFEDGIFAMNGEHWRIWRKFLVQSMKEIGLGTKEQLKSPMNEAIEATLVKLQRSGDQAVNITSLLLIQCTEVIRKLMIGDNAPNNTVNKINEHFRIVMLPLSDFDAFLCGKMARFITQFRVKGFSETKKAKEEMSLIFRNLINDHKKSFDPNNAQDIIDLYLRERHIREKKKDPLIKYFTDKAFIDILIQIYGDGSFTIGALLAYLINILAKRIDVQETIFSEIAENIGIERLATYEDRPKLPYTNSAIKEMFRTFNFASVLPSLECTADTTISGVFVPKGTIALINNYEMSNESSVYKNPEQFNPKRFISSDNLEESKENSPLIFGLGKRSCIGETLVMTEMFLFLTAIIQNFKIRLPKSHLDDEGKDPFQEEYYIIATSRKN